MQFYKNKNYDYHYIRYNKLSFVNQDSKQIIFYKDGKTSNKRNAAIIYYGIKAKHFCLNDLFYGYDTSFTKQYWRQFTSALNSQ